MKTIPIPVQVPDWAKWVAQDEGGDWCVYESRPVDSKTSWFPTDKRLAMCVAGGSPNPNWRETLREVE